MEMGVAGKKWQAKKKFKIDLIVWKYVFHWLNSIWTPRLNRLNSMEMKKKPVLKSEKKSKFKIDLIVWKCCCSNSAIFASYCLK